MLRLSRILPIAALAIYPISSAIAADDRKAGPKEIRLLGYDTYSSQHKTIVLNDPSAPLQIQVARTFLLSINQRTELQSRLSSYYRRLVPEGPIVEIDARGKNIVAAKFGVLFYDSFNEWAGGFTGVTTDPPDRRMRWSHRKNIAWREFGIACVFVRAARFQDGRVWRADLDKVAEMMVEKGCSVENQTMVTKRLKALPKGAVRL